MKVFYRNVGQMTWTVTIREIDGRKADLSTQDWGWKVIRVRRGESSRNSASRKLFGVPRHQKRKQRVIRICVTSSRRRPIAAPGTGRSEGCEKKNIQGETGQNLSLKMKK